MMPSRTTAMPISSNSQRIFPIVTLGGTILMVGAFFLPWLTSPTLRLTAMDYIRNYPYQDIFHNLIVTGLGITVFLLIMSLLLVITRWGVFAWIIFLFTFVLALLAFYGLGFYVALQLQAPGVLYTLAPNDDPSQRSFGVGLYLIFAGILVVVMGSLGTLVTAAKRAI